MANPILLLHCHELDNLLSSPILQQILSESNQTLETLSLENSSECVPWKIQNKYYSADTHIHVHTHHRKELWSPIAEQSLAIIFVFYKDQPESFEILKRIEQIGSPETKLCIGINKSPNFELSEEKISAIEDFCIDNALEFIDMDQQPIEVEEDDIKESVGISRVIEALATNTWEGMVVNKKKQQKSDEYVTENEVEATRNKIFGKLDLEDTNDGFEHALKTISSMRDQAKNLPDDERRKLAAQVALSFLKQFDLSDEELDFDDLE